jgi:hypothetical protein
MQKQELMPDILVAIHKHLPENFNCSPFLREMFLSPELERM